MEMDLYYDKEYLEKYNGLFVENTSAHRDKSMHDSLCHMIVYVAHGKGGYKNNHSNIELNEGDILLINPIGKHCLYTTMKDRELSIYCCSFLPGAINVRPKDLAKYFPTLSNFLNGEKTYLVTHDTPRLDIRNTMVKLLDNASYKFPAYSVSMRALLTEIFIDALRLYTAPSDGENSFNKNFIIGHTVNYVNRHLQEKIFLSDVAEYMHISVQHICRVFKQHTGKTFNEYVNKLRVDKIKDELENTDRPIFCIYDDFDFTSQHLNRVFKQHTGYTIPEYKEMFNYKVNNPLYRKK